MSSFFRPDLSAPAKALGLVRLHHGLPSRGGEEVPGLSGTPRVRPGRFWQRGARLNHLSARRRRIALERIPDALLPAVLELSGGSRCVILLGRESGASGESGESGESAYRVQFPDSREAVVSGERLRQHYDGVCVLLAPSPPGRQPKA